MMLLAAVLAALPGPASVFDWPAYPEQGMIELINPANLAWQSGMMLSIGLPSSDSSLHGPDRVFLGAPGIGASGWWERDGDLRRFTVASGSAISGGALAVGAAYNWIDPVSSDEWEGARSWDVGISFRPSEAFSAALVRRGGYEADEVREDALLRAGVAVRPFGSLLTLTADAGTDEGFEDLDVSGGLEVRPVVGSAIRLDFSDEHVSMGVAADFGHIGAVFSGILDDVDGIWDGSDYSGGRAEIRFTSSPRASLVPPRRRYVRIETGGTGEEPSRSFLGPVERSFSEEILLIERAVDDPSVEGLIVDTDGGAGTAAQAEELRAQLVRARGMGKRVLVYLTSPGNMECYLASAGTDLWIHPAGETSLTGFAAHGIFLRDLLDNVGIYPDLLHIGEFKSASEMLTRSDMSESQRIAETALLESFHRELFLAVNSGRGLDAPQLATILEAGMMSPSEAVSTGLVDSTAFPDEIEERLSRIDGHGIRIQSLDEYSSSIPVDDEWGPRPHIAVIVATGFITRGESGYSFPMGESMGSETICNQMRHAASQPGVRGLVLRIDSGGGDAFASEEMLHCATGIAESIPVVVSMGGVAASGGYYIACGADSIFADRFTITGSIGVISGKFAVEDLLARIGVNVETISPYPMADAFSPFSRFTDEQRERMGEMIRDSYELFTSRVADARGMTMARVDSVGRGRVWSGSDALEAGLVDRIGGLVDAVRCAAGLAGLDEDWVPSVAVYPRPGLFDGLGLNPFGGASLSASDIEEMLRGVSVLNRPMYLMQPFVVD